MFETEGINFIDIVFMLFIVLDCVTLVLLCCCFGVVLGPPCYIDKEMNSARYRMSMSQGIAERLYGCFAHAESLLKCRNMKTYPLQLHVKFKLSLPP